MGVVAGAVCAIAVALLRDGAWHTHWVLLLALLGAAGVGFLDDLTSLRTALRLPLYLTLGGALAVFSARVEVLWLPGLPQIALGEIGGIAFSTLFIAWYANLFNFMDGIDGIAGCTSVVTHVALGMAMLARGLRTLATLCFALVGSSLGFLLYNFPLASVFMGDGGAVFLGFSSGALSLLAVQHGACSMPASVLFMLPFVFDATFTLLRRIVERERFWAAHRSHIYQQLCDLGFSHRSVTVIFTALGVGCAGTGLELDGWPPARRAVVWWGTLALFLGLSIWVVVRNRRRCSAAPARSRRSTPAPE